MKNSLLFVFRNLWCNETGTRQLTASGINAPLIGGAAGGGVVVIIIVVVVVVVIMKRSKFLVLSHYVAERFI